MSPSPDSTFLSAGPQPQQHPTLNRYIPQSPQPASPPQTPSPSSPHHKAPQTAMDSTILPPQPLAPVDTIKADRLSPTGTPDGYAYTSPEGTRPPNSRSNSSSSSLAGMGINFPSNDNPLPPALHSPNREISPLPDVQESTAQVSMPRSRSSEGASAQPPSAAMAQSLSAGSATAVPTSSSSSSFPGTSSLGPQSLYGNLHPSTSNQFSSRPRTVSPRPLTSADAFASSSSISQNPNSEARGRVVSPHKMDGMGVSSPIDYSPSINSLLDNPSSSASANPYDSLLPQSQSGRPAFQFNSYGQHQPFHPLTGKEAQYGSTPTVQPAVVPFTDSVGYWLGLYFFFNLGLTLFNKFVLVSFPFPYTLTGLHALSGCAGTYIALEQGAFTPARLTQKENLILAAFSVLYTINIAVSNISLQLVTVPFHQVVRASTPLFTILISTVFLRSKFSFMKLVSLLPVVAGVGFATYGDYYFTAWGLFLTLLGTFLAALKTVVTNLIQTGGGGRLKLHPLDLLMRMSPLAFIQCVVYGWYTGELERVRRYGATQMTRTKAFALLINGIIACGLNIVSFTANKKAGALTMTVSANCKQVLTIALAVVLFNLSISPTNGLGILLTLIGGGWYGYVEYTEKKRKVVKLVDRA